DPPDLTCLPSSEILGVTVILLTCSYDEREFVRVGYYVNNEYDSEELNNDPPAKPIIDRVRRNILAEKPRVTRFAIKWDSEESAPAEYPPEQPGVDQEEDDGTAYGAEEAEMQAALEKELEETEKAPQSGDAAMAGTGEAQATTKDDDEVSNAGSEDLEEDSSDDDEEDEEEEEGGENDGDEDMEIADGEEKPAQTNGEAKSVKQASHPEVMVH
ncbi:MAG: Histone chaperone asf1, partial [Watsoniomyces obsoletus]